MLRRLPTFSPRQVEQLALAALATLGLIVLTGAAVRLTGSGLGCPNWPKCGEGVVAPLETHAWIEYGNRLASALVGLVCFAAGFAAWRRRPFRRDLAILGTLLPLGVLLQGVLGGLTVLFELKPGFVMGHFLLSMVILAPPSRSTGARATSPRSSPSRRTTARLVKATRVLLPLGALAILAGTVATAAGPHAGENEEQRAGLAPRPRSGRSTPSSTGTAGRGRCSASPRSSSGSSRAAGARATELRRALTALCLLVAAQGVIGFAQYELELPAGDRLAAHPRRDRRRGSRCSSRSPRRAASPRRPFRPALVQMSSRTPRHPQFWGGPGRTCVEYALIGRRAAPTASPSCSARCTDARTIPWRDDQVSLAAQLALAITAPLAAAWPVRVPRDGAEREAPIARRRRVRRAAVRGRGARVRRAARRLASCTPRARARRRACSSPAWRPRSARSPPPRWSLGALTDVPRADGASFTPDDLPADRPRRRSPLLAVRAFAARRDDLAFTVFAGAGTIGLAPIAVLVADFSGRAAARARPAARRAARRRPRGGPQREPRPARRPHRPAEPRALPGPRRPRALRRRAATARGRS